MVCRDVSFTVFLLAMLLVMLSAKSTKFGSRYLIDRLSEGNEIWHDGSPGFAVHNAEIGKTLAQWD